MKSITQKITLLVALLIITFSLTACGNDASHATVTYTTSTGKAGITHSYNGEGKFLETQGRELALERRWVIPFEDGETVKITFNCDDCGCEETLETTEALAKMFACECEGENDNKKEYAAVLVQKAEEKQQEETAK